MKQYQKFLRYGISLAPVGIETREPKVLYFCTPKGASLIGYAGVDGIHYCFIRGFGEMVFAVSPMNTAPDFVHPLAKDFSDFLRLLLACGNAAAPEQAWMWNKEQFEAFLKENPADGEQRKTLCEIAEKMNLTAMEQPWEYIRSLQSSFDYSKIRYMEDYRDPDMNPAAEPDIPEWKVFFEGGFFGHRGKSRAGKELPIGIQFDWADRHWLIPAVYACGKGLVMDICMRTDADAIRAFTEKRNLTQENDASDAFTREQQIEMEAENPLSLRFTPHAVLNGQTLRTAHGCAVTYNPCLPNGMIREPEAEWAAEHYGLDTSYGWVIYRNSFPWASGHRPKIKTLSLTMEPEPIPVPGPHFTVKAPGDSFCFIHPVSRIPYTLTVQEYRQQTLPKNSFGAEKPSRYFYPTHNIVMLYTLSPEPSEPITVSDCADGDKPLAITPADDDAFAPAAENSAACIGIIGGADGPTAVMAGGNTPGGLHAVCSALHFEPVRDDIVWRITFEENRYRDVSVILTEI
ncbi:MAG: hypothetical protein ACI3XM_10305 [Eubacteriales bacterium]